MEKALTQKRIYTGIDLFKLIAAVLIVILHELGTTLGEPGRLFINTFCYMAVPFFFICSGYFFAKGLNKSQDKKQYFISYEKKLVKMYVLWTIISLPISIYQYSTLPSYSGNFLKIFLVHIRKIFFSGSFGIYWYLLSLILGAGLIYIFSKFNKIKLMYFLSTIFFLIGVLYTGFQPLLTNITFFKIIFKATHIIFSSSNNFLMTGWFYLSLGFFFSMRRIKIKIPAAIIGLTLSTFLTFSENYLYVFEKAIFGANVIFPPNSLLLFQSIQAVFFFLLAYNLTLPSLTKYSLTMRQLSSTIYFTHFIFLAFLDNNQTKNGLIIIPILLLLCTCFYFIVRKINNPKLNILING